MRLSQEFAAVVLIVLAGGYAVVREALILGFALFGFHFPFTNCHVGSGPGC